MHLGQDVIKTVPVILFDLQNSWSAGRHKNQLREGWKMSSTDKMGCSPLIKRRCEIRPVDAVFSSENRSDYLCTLWEGTHKHSRANSHSSSVFILFKYLFILIPHFHSAPQQLQTSYDTHCWLLPLARRIAGDRREWDRVVVPASLNTLKYPLYPWKILPRRGWTSIVSEAVSHPEQRTAPLMCVKRNCKILRKMKDERLKRSFNLCRGLLMKQMPIFIQCVNAAATTVDVRQEAH